jgi:small subunit ribosomal protein S18
MSSAFGPPGERSERSERREGRHERYPRRDEPQSVKARLRAKARKKARKQRKRGFLRRKVCSGNCARHQRPLAVAIKRARHLALLPTSSQYL